MSNSEVSAKLSLPKRLLFAAFVVLLILFSIEGAFSIYDYLLPSPPSRAEQPKDESFTRAFQSIHELKPGSKMLYGLRPNSRTKFRLNRKDPVEYVINSKGFRDKEYFLEKPPDTTRIAVLGDSITFGFEVPVEASYPKVMEEILNKSGGGKFEVLNFGVGGYSTYSELAQLQETVLNYHPDIVVLGFCMNDVNHPYAEFTPHTLESLGQIPEDAIPNPAVTAKPSLVKRAGLMLGQYSHAIHHLQLWLARLRKEATEPKATFELHYKNCLDALARADSPEWAWLGKKLSRMDEICRANNVKLAVAIFPLYYQLDKRYAFSRSRELLVEFCRSRSIPAIDLYDTFEDYTLDTGQVIYLDLIHPNEIGHRLAAQAIVDVIKR